MSVESNKLHMSGLSSFLLPVGLIILLYQMYAEKSIKLHKSK